MRGGLTIAAGILAGNLLGFGRGAVTAYLLGTHAMADGLAVALGPIDTLNQVLINTMIFAFVPLLTVREGRARAILFTRAARLFTAVFSAVSLGMMGFAPELIRLLGPGLSPSVFGESVTLLRIGSLSTWAAGTAAVHSALLYTERRFGPPAFNQATINAFVIVGALALWKPFGIYGFAIGYSIGAVAQLGIVWAFGRKSRARLLRDSEGDAVTESLRELALKPGAFLAYAGLLALNLIVTRRFATQDGPGMAAAFDYCMRCVSVLMAYLVYPVSNTLLPEISGLRSENRSHDAARLIRRALKVTALASVASCLAAMLVRQPVIALLFERGHFTSESTALVAQVFLGFAPSVIGLSLLEVASRSLFALEKPWPAIWAAVIPVTVNVAFFAVARPSSPSMIGAGASMGLFAGGLLAVSAALRRSRLPDRVEPGLHYISQTSK